MARAVIGRWGKNLAVRFPSEVAKNAGLRAGQAVEIAATDDELVIRKLPREFSIESLFAGKSSETWRALYRDLFDWGPDRGRERVEE